MTQTNYQSLTKDLDSKALLQANETSCHKACSHNNSSSNVMPSLAELTVTEQIDLVKTELKHKHNEDKKSKLIGFMDLAGVIASSLCLVHCLLMPFIVALVPIFAAHLLHDKFFHPILALTVLLFCLMAYIPGYLKHRSKKLIFLGMLGLSLVFFATFFAHASLGEFAEVSIITAGNLILVLGHLYNRWLLWRGCCPGNH